MNRFWLCLFVCLYLLVPACGGAEEDGASPTPGGAPPETPTAPAGDEVTPPDDARVIRVQVTGRTVTPRLGTVDVRIGETVRIEVTADTADEIHVHGYDRTGDLAPGQAGSVEFEANIPGTFEVELEKARLKLFDLRVQ